MEALCEPFGVSRQAWYKAMSTSELTDFKSGVLLDEIRRIRAKLPGIGVEKLHFLLQKDRFYQKWNLKIGRDKLRNLLAEHGLLALKKRTRVRTTNSLHPFRKYPNLVQNVALEKPNQVWVTDITYVPVGAGFGYLSLVTDAFSRKIVGWAFSKNLAVQGSLDALEMAINSQSQSLRNLLHHSDRGIQYCSEKYIKMLKNNKIGISMTQNGDPYENALAERMNRTIKDEMLQNRGFVNHQTAENALFHAIQNYNEARPHASLDYQTPQIIHRKTTPVELKKRWRKRSFIRLKTTANSFSPGGGITSFALF
jgi:putative transposase